MADEPERDQPLLSDSQFELEADTRRGGTARIVIFFGGSLLIAAALATIALYVLNIGPFEPPPAPLQADTQPLPPAPAPPPAEVKPELKPEPTPAVKPVTAQAEPPDHKGKKGKKAKAAGKKKKKH